MKQLKTAVDEMTERATALAKKRNISFSAALEEMQMLDPSLFKRYQLEGQTGVAHPRTSSENAATNEAVEVLVKRYQAEHGVTFSEAAEAVMKEPGIYQAYRRQVTV